MPNMLTSAMESIFGVPPVAPQVVQVVAAPPPAPIVVDPANPNPTIPTDPNAPPAPLAKHAKLWETVPVAKGNEPPKSFLESITAENVAAAAATVSVQDVVTPEILERIGKGGADAVKATLEAVDLMNRKTYANSALASTEILKRALGEQSQEFTKNLPKAIREASIRGSSKAKDANLADPALLPITNALETQFATKYPEATADEIAGMVQEYFGDVVKKLTKTETKKPSNGRGAEEIDWDEFANGGLNLGKF